MHKRRIAYLIAGFSLMLVILLLLRFWMLQHAELFIRKLVDTQTQGLYDLHIQQIHLDNNLHVIRLEHTTLKAFEPDRHTPRFILEIPYLYLKIHRIPALILNRALYIDSIYCRAPALLIRLQQFPASDSTMSLAAQMDIIYLQIQKIVSLLQIEKMHIEQGELIFSANPAYPDSEATRIQKISLHIQHFKIDAATVRQQRKRKQLTNEVTFHLGPQTIFLNHKQQKISFADFYLSTVDSACRIRALSFYAQAKDKPVSSYAFAADELYFKKNQFSELYFNKTFQSDSLMIQHARVTLQVHLNIKATHPVKDTSQLLEAVLSRIADRAAVRHVVIQDAMVKVLAGAASTQYIFQTGKQQLNLHEVIFDARSENPFSIQQASLNMQHYTFQSSDSSLQFSLQQLILHQDTLMLVAPNLHQQDMKTGNQLQFQAARILVPNVDLNNLISQQNIGTHEMIIEYPDIRVIRTSMFTSHERKSDLIPKKWMHGFRLFDALQVVQLRHGIFNITTPSLHLQANDVNGSNSFPLAAVFYPDRHRQWQIASLQFQWHKNHEEKNIVEGDAQNLTIEDRLFRAGAFHLHQSHQSFACEQCYMLLPGQTKDSAPHAWPTGSTIAQAGWQQANIQLQLSDTANHPLGGLFSPFLIGHVQGEHTKLLIQSFKRQHVAQLQSSLTHIRLDSFAYLHNQLHVRDFRIAGTEGKYRTDNFWIAFQDFSWRPDSLSFVHQLHIHTLPDSTLDMQIPAVSWIHRLPKIDEDALRQIPFLQLDTPVITMRKLATHGVQSQTSFLQAASWHVDSLRIQEGRVQLLQYAASSRGKPHLQVDFQLTGSATNLNWQKLPTDYRFHLQHLNAHLHNFELQRTSATTHQNFSPTRVHADEISLTASQWTSASSTDNGQLFVDSCAFANIWISDEQHQLKGSGKIYALQLTNILSPSFIAQSLSHSANHRLHLSAIRYQTPAFIFQGWDAIYHANSQLLQIDSVHIHPVKSREAFMKALQEQKDYVSFSSHQWKWQRFNLLSWIMHQTLVADTFDVYRPVVYVYRDKRLPLNTRQVKPLPAEVPDRLPFKMHVNQWRIHEGFASYTEISAQTGKPGTVWFNDIQARITPVISHDFDQRIDSAEAYLQIQATGRLMNQPLIHLNYLEDRYDPLHLFTLRVQASPFAFSLFNPILESWFHARVISGNITGANMQAKGNRYMMLGNMNLHYDQLKISLDREKDSAGRKLHSGLQNFLANLVLRSANFHRTGLVFYRRNPHLSFFNYWVKGVESGIGSSIMGNKWNRAYR
ncbi:MAG: hypothetical protein IRZ29_08165, partial [Thermoflavifilum sp.]|nr:hypothetical protein [Thermoflavifilum sp.]